MKHITNAISTVALILFIPQTALHAQAEKTPLAKKMSAINTAFKLVGRQVDDASKNASTLEQLTIIETNAKSAMTLSPKKKAQVPSTGQAKFQSDYEAEMKAMSRRLAKSGQRSKPARIRKPLRLLIR